MPREPEQRRAPDDFETCANEHRVQLLRRAGEAFPARLGPQIAGQRTLAEVEYIPAMPAVPAKTPELKPESGGFKANVLPPETVTQNLERWTAIKKELFN